MTQSASHTPTTAGIFSATETGYSWETSDNSLIGLYTVTVTATEDGCGTTSSDTYSVTIVKFEGEDNIVASIAASLFRQKPIILEELPFDNTEVFLGEIGKKTSYEVKFVDPLAQSIEEYGEEVPEEYQPEGIKISVVYKSFAYFSLEVEYPEDPKGYGNAFFVIDGIEAGKETIAEAVEKDCETAFTGYVTLEVQD